MKSTSKEKVLDLLEQNRGSFVSGELIAGRLQLSRNAVWKAISGLRKCGYRIEAVTNRGYCLSEDNDVVSEAGILRCLRREGCRVHVFEELPSTNLTAKEYAVAGALHGTTVIAMRQSRGAGRKAEQFISPEGGLYMSVILRPAGPEDCARKAAAAVCMAIETVCGVFPEIRGLDDLYLNGKKICGILTESSAEVESGMVHYYVVGIGIRFSRPAGETMDMLPDDAGFIYNGSPSKTRNVLAAEILDRLLDDLTDEELEEVYRKRKKD